MLQCCLKNDKRKRLLNWVKDPNLDKNGLCKKMCWVPYLKTAAKTTVL